MNSHNEMQMQESLPAAKGAFSNEVGLANRKEETKSSKNW